MLEWDPIGIADVPEAQDEYDRYIGTIEAILMRHEPRRMLVEHLLRIGVQMGLFLGDYAHTEATADRLLRLRDEIEQST